MSDLSIFAEKENQPAKADLPAALGEKLDLWNQIEEMVFQKYPNGVAEWNFPGKKYGWSYRIKDKKRAILYFLPRDKSFMVAFVFGDKALEKILASDIRDEIKEDLKNARKYAEGRGIRIDISDDSVLSDIEKLVEIKLS